MKNLIDLTIKEEGTGIPPRNYPKHPRNHKAMGEQPPSISIVAVRFVQEDTFLHKM